MAKFNTELVHDHLGECSIYLRPTPHDSHPTGGAAWTLFNLIRPVLVKVRVTEAYKKLVAAELQEVLKRIELEMQSLDFQIRRLDSGLDRKNSQEASVARQRLEQERSLRQEKRRQLLDKLKEIGQLAPGTEVFLSKMESMVELKPGDEWSKVLGVEIIIQDGVVVEIRQGQTGKDPYHE